MEWSLDKLKQAVSLKEQISALEKRLGSLFGSESSTAATSGNARRARKGRRGRRTMSSDTRAKLAAAAKARWAKRRGDGEAAAPMKSAAKPASKAPAKSATKSTAAKKKGGLSAEGRARLSQAMKARWAARRKAATKKS